jgi:DNA-binding Lrp family transcriptional regulator
LEKKGIILGYRLFFKSVEHKPFLILLSFKNYSTEKEKKLIAYVARKDSITQTLRMFGIWNLFLHIRIEDIEKLQNLIIEIRDKFDIIDNYELIPVFEDISIDLLPV